MVNTGSRGNTVVNYVLGNEGLRERIERLEIGKDIDSDHHPVFRISFPPNFLNKRRR